MFCLRFKSGGIANTFTQDLSLLQIKAFFLYWDNILGHNINLWKCVSSLLFWILQVQFYTGIHNITWCMNSIYRHHWKNTLLQFINISARTKHVPFLQVPVASGKARWGLGWVEFVLYNDTWVSKEFCVMCDHAFSKLANHQIRH